MVSKNLKSDMELRDWLQVNKLSHPLALLIVNHVPSYTCCLECFKVHIGTDVNSIGHEGRDIFKFINIRGRED